MPARGGVRGLHSAEMMQIEMMVRHKSTPSGHSMGWSAARRLALLPGAGASFRVAGVSCQRGVRALSIVFRLS